MLWNSNDKYAGWAADAHPEMTSDELRSMVGRMLDHEANLLWIGHNNPGEVGVDKWEPALSYAVCESYVDGASHLHDAAKARSTRYRARSRLSSISSWTAIMRVSGTRDHLRPEPPRATPNPIVHIASASTRNPLGSEMGLMPSSETRDSSCHVHP